jgi:hypothetical protein
MMRPIWTGKSRQKYLAFERYVAGSVRRKRQAEFLPRGIPFSFADGFVDPNPVETVNLL